MPARRKSLNDLALSGTLSNNSGRYKARIEAETAPKATRVATGPIGRVPGHLNKDEKACWREIVQSVPDGVLGQSDRLLVEVASQLMVKQRAGTAKVAEMNRLVKILERFTTQPESVPEPMKPVAEKSDVDLFFDQCAKEAAEDRLIRAEMQRRSNLGLQPRQTPNEFERWCWWATVRDEFEKQPQHLD